jgi:hypothetical protein
MADQHSTAAELREALWHLFDMHARVDTLLRAFDDCAGDAEPAWLSTIRLVYQPARDADAEFEGFVFARVLPILEAHDQASSALPAGDVIEGEVS